MLLSQWFIFFLRHGAGSSTDQNGFWVGSAELGPKETAAIPFSKWSRWWYTQVESWVDVKYAWGMEVWPFLSGKYISHNVGENPETLYIYVVSIQINSHLPLIHCVALGKSFHSPGLLSTHPPTAPRAMLSLVSSFINWCTLHGNWATSWEKIALCLQLGFSQSRCLSEGGGVGWGLAITARSKETLEPLRRFYPLEETSGGWNWLDEGAWGLEGSRGPMCGGCLTLILLHSVPWRIGTGEV